METICIKRQILFSGKNKKIILPTCCLLNMHKKWYHSKLLVHVFILSKNITQVHIFIDPKFNTVPLSPLLLTQRSRSSTLNFNIEVYC